MPRFFAHFATLPAVDWLSAGAAVLCSYLIGSTPFGVFVARSKGVDIRQFGSGNIGATNVGRALGRRWGFVVFALDFLKGFVPTLCAVFLGPRLGDDQFTRHDLPVLCALAAVLGHVFSVWLGFRGGKAGATGLGVGAVLSWQAMLVAAVAWLVVWAVTRYISLATIVGSVAYSVAFISLAVFLGSPFDREHASVTAFCAFATILVVARHKSNIDRLLKGTEPKV